MSLLQLLDGLLEQVLMLGCNRSHSIVTKLCKIELGLLEVVTLAENVHEN